MPDQDEKVSAVLLYRCHFRHKHHRTIHHVDVKVNRHGQQAAMTHYEGIAWCAAEKTFKGSLTGVNLSDLSRSRIECLEVSYEL